MQEIIQIKETCLYIRNLEAAKEFYHGRLGLSIIHYEPEKHIFFRAGSSVLLCFNPDDSRHKDSPPPHYAEGDQHYAFEVAQKDYNVVKEKIRTAGITIIDEVVWNNGKESFYFKDPEDNILEFVPAGVWD